MKLKDNYPKLFLLLGGILLISIFWIGRNPDGLSFLDIIVSLIFSKTNVRTKSRRLSYKINFMNLKLHKPLCIFDLETTGINISKDRIVEICILKFFQTLLEKSKTWYVNPKCLFLQKLPQFTEFLMKT